MAAVAQAINKIVTIAEQVALGTVKSGSGGTVLTRTSSVSTNARDTNQSNVITSDQQSRGVSYGAHKPTIKTSSELTTETFQLPIAGLLRNDFTAVADITGLAVTVAGSGPYTLTDASTPATFLTDGIKVGMIVRLTAGSFNAANLNKNILVTAVTETVITGVPLNGVALVDEGPISSATVSVPGKRSSPPLTSQTNKFYTLEDFYKDISKSEVFQDLRPNQIDISVPASGAATISVDWIGLKRTVGTSQTLTSPTEHTFRKMEAVNAAIYVNGVAYTDITTFSLSIQGQGEMVGPTVGNNYGSDVTRGTLMVSGSFTELFTSTTLRDYVDAETNVSIVLAIAQDNSANSPVMAFAIGKAKLTSDTPDDGKFVARTYSFTAELDDAGGAALAWPETIVSVQDSQA